MTKKISIIVGALAALSIGSIVLAGASGPVYLDPATGQVRPAQIPPTTVAYPKSTVTQWATGTNTVPATAIATPTSTADSIPMSRTDGKIDNDWIKTGTGTNQVVTGADPRLTDGRTSTDTLYTVEPVRVSIGTSTTVGTSAAVASSPKISINTGTATNQVIMGSDSRLSDDRVARGLRNASGVVDVYGAAAPSTGQVLRATSSSAATWQTLGPADVSALPATNVNVSTNRVAKGGASAGTLTDSQMFDDGTRSGALGAFSTGAASPVSSSAFQVHSAVGENLFVFPGSELPGVGTLFLDVANDTHTVLTPLFLRARDMHFRVESGASVLLSTAGDATFPANVAARTAVVHGGVTGNQKFAVNSPSVAPNYVMEVRAAGSPSVPLRLVTDGVGRGFTVAALTNEATNTGYGIQFNAREGSTPFNSLYSYANINTGAIDPLLIGATLVDISGGQLKLRGSTSGAVTHGVAATTASYSMLAPSTAPGPSQAVVYPSGGGQGTWFTPLASTGTNYAGCTTVSSTGGLVTACDTTARVPESRTVTCGNGLSQTGGPALSSNVTCYVSNVDGSINVGADTISVGTINDTQHGNRGGGALHAAVTQTTNGFMTAADKTKLDYATATPTTSRLVISNSNGNLNDWISLSYGPFSTTPGINKVPYLTAGGDLNAWITGKTLVSSTTFTDGSLLTNPTGAWQTLASHTFTTTGTQFKVHVEAVYGDGYDNARVCGIGIRADSGATATTLRGPGGFQRFGQVGAEAYNNVFPGMFLNGSASTNASFTLTAGTVTIAIAGYAPAAGLGGVQCNIPASSATMIVDVYK